MRVVEVMVIVVMSIVEILDDRTNDSNFDDDDSGRVTMIVVSEG